MMDNKERLVVELRYLAIILAVSIVLFRLVFYKDPISLIARLVLTYFIIIVLPGYALMVQFNHRFNFQERLLLGIGAGSTLLALTSYTIGFFYSNLYVHVFVYLALTISFLTITKRCRA